MKNEIIKSNVEGLIYEINGKEIMLDSDLAIIYGCKNGTKEINQAVKNNIDKFPKRYSWVLSNTELKYLRSKFLTANINSKSRNNPRVFTEQGIYMLATILKGKRATKVTLNIMDTFVQMRNYINRNKLLLPSKILSLEGKVNENTKRINELFDKFDPKVNFKNYLFFDGEFYDSYSLILHILSSATKRIVIIDNYANNKILDILKTINKDIIIVSSNMSEELQKKYQKQYANITFIKSNKFHDRFIIIDDMYLYHLGCSLKDMGRKCFAINLIDSEESLKGLLKRI